MYSLNCQIYMHFKQLCICQKYALTVKYAQKNRCHFLSKNCDSNKEKSISVCFQRLKRPTYICILLQPLLITYTPAHMHIFKSLWIFAERKSLLGMLLWTFVRGCLVILRRSWALFLLLWIDKDCIWVYFMLVCSCSF